MLPEDGGQERRDEGDVKARGTASEAQEAAGAR